MERLLGIPPADLEFLQGYVSSLKDTYTEILKGDFN